MTWVRTPAGIVLLVMAFASALVVMSCGSAPVVPLPASMVPQSTAMPSLAGSGITGTVVIGPNCPVQSIGNPCPDRPISAQVVIRDRGGAVVALTTSDGSGRFSVTLAPGSYAVTAERGGAGPGTRSPSQTVIVVTGRSTEIALAVDSGIR